MIKRQYAAVFLFAGAMSLFLLSCGSCGEEVKEGNEAAVDTTADFEKTLREEGKNVIRLMPSPLQVAFIIKKSGIAYNEKVLHDPKKASEYTSQYKKSLNLGVYGADLGYSAMYEKNQQAINYMNASKQLGDELNITGAFEQSTLERVEKNLGNKDSIIDIVTTTFRKSDQYLKDNQRNSTAALVIAGGWIEALYIATQMVKEEKNEAIIDRIGEQKIALSILISLLQQFGNEDEQTGELANQLKELRDIYKEVKINYEYQEPTTDENTQTTTVNTTSKVEISDEQLKKITDKVATIRNQITE